MISKEEENKTRQVRENLRNQKSLYDTFKDVYDKAKPVSRILMMLKIVQVVDPQQKRKDKEKEKELNKDTIPNFINMKGKYMIKKVRVIKIYLLQKKLGFYTIIIFVI